MKMRLIRVNTLFYFTYRNNLIDFMVTLFITYKLKMSNFIKVPDSLVFTAISDFDFQDFLGSPCTNSQIAVTAFLIAFLIKNNNKKLDQIIFHVSDNLITFHVQSYFVLHMWNILEHL